MTPWSSPSLQSACLPGGHTTVHPPQAAFAGAVHDALTPPGDIIAAPPHEHTDICPHTVVRQSPFHGC